MLSQVVRENLNAAIEKENTDAVFRFTKLLLPLNLEDEAFSALAEYLKSVVARKGHAEYQKLSTALESRSRSSIFVDQISALFRFVAHLCEDHDEVVLRC